MTETQVLYMTSHSVILNILILCDAVYVYFLCKQVEWTPYMSYGRHLMNEHPRTAYIGGITCFDIVEVYLLERTVRQLGFAQAIPLLR